MIPPAVVAMPAAISGSRGPWAPTMRPDSGEHMTIIAAIGSVYSSCAQRRQAARVLQVQGVPEQEAAQRGERAHRDHRRAPGTARCGRTSGRPAARAQRGSCPASPSAGNGMLAISSHYYC